jgi:hypothetical protein
LWQVFEQRERFQDVSDRKLVAGHRRDEIEKLVLLHYQIVIVGEPLYLNIP